MTGYTFGYRRVSSVQQNYERQTAQLHAAGIPEERIYEDKLSGRTMDRPGLNALLAVARPGDEIVVTSMDRLGRTALGILQTLKDLDDRGITVRSLKDGENFEGVTGKLLLHVMLAISEWERENTRERAAEGRAAWQAKGRKPRSRTVLTDDNVIAIRAMREKNIPISKIVSTMKISRASVYRALSDDTSHDTSQDKAAVG